MFDTIALTIETGIKQEILDNLENHISKSGRGVYHLNNFMLESVSGRFYLSGSIPKYKNNSNILSLSDSDFVEVLDDIGRRLEVDLHKSFVRRLDFGFCFYSSNLGLLNCLGFHSDSRIEYHLFGAAGVFQGVEFRGGGRGFVVYRKDIENGQEIGGRALYRAEYRVKGRQAIKRLFCNSDINPYVLINKGAKKVLKKRMKSFYDKIEKRDIKGFIDYSCKCSEKEIVNTLAYLFLKENPERASQLAAAGVDINKIKHGGGRAFLYQQQASKELDGYINNFCS